MNSKTENITNENSKNTLISCSEKEKLSHYEDLIRKLFYACEKCDGALVQLATCVVCKRTVMRICIRCRTVLRIPHGSCEIVHGKHFVDSTFEVSD